MSVCMRVCVCVHGYIYINIDIYASMLQYVHINECIFSCIF